MLVKEGGDYQPVLAMETKPSELGEMEEESLVAQVPCQPGVVTANFHLGIKARENWTNK